MLSPPDDLDPDVLTGALTREWGLAVASLAYREAGFGSHHWVVTDPASTGWFVTVDDLPAKRRDAAEGLDRAFARLGGALDAARRLREAGAAFVVAPLPTAGDEPVIRLGQRYAVAVYPLVEGVGFGFGFDAYADEAHRRGALEMVIGVHAAPPPVRDRALADDFAVPHHDALEAALSGDAASDCGPYAVRAAELITGHAEPIRALMRRHDELAAGADPRRAVLTHGEPHAGNTMRTDAGWRLVDWDTALVAPPERDLWLIGGDLSAYTAATGVEVMPEMLEMYRLRWRLADLAVDVDRFRRPHPGDRNDDESFRVLSGVVAGIRP
ncbi:phosphotransferase [Mangrovihabitans endophyticus]|uniref:Aminoglycoside phosphotransferase domain-containing protein n=1 Tax=Mangrovihabitans endophyticus TaxID=1751298 RepID=A0A8J3C583_9ACTN|nr:phosphotransferase [Mangrovihabitans endophyticus]GGL09123.1 hypothetical protein GCM10012284_49710 [Mangrovihabitans endophyticus]